MSCASIYMRAQISFLERWGDGGERLAEQSRVAFLTAEADEEITHTRRSSMYMYTSSFKSACPPGVSCRSLLPEGGWRLPFSGPSRPIRWRPRVFSPRRSPPRSRSALRWPCPSPVLPSALIVRRPPSSLISRFPAPVITFTSRFTAAWFRSR